MSGRCSPPTRLRGAEWSGGDSMTAEGKRLEEAREQQVPWRLGRAAGVTEVAPRPAARGASGRRR
jgi:hypothetical protein